MDKMPTTVTVDTVYVTSKTKSKGPASRLLAADRIMAD